FGKSQLAHGIPGKWLIESPDYGKVGEFFRGSLMTNSVTRLEGVCRWAPYCPLDSMVIRHDPETKCRLWYSK
ncbi:MAG: hypothetical protein COB48_09935, partial [Pseudoalteromonas sp.]